MKKKEKAVKNERHSLLFYGILVLAIISVVGAILVFQLTQDAQSEIEGGHSDAAGTVSITVDSPSYESSSEATGKVTLTIVEEN